MSLITQNSLIGYLPVGFPDLNTSVEAALALLDSGVDVLELGLPYSDPVLDGPVIQSATQTALEAGFRVRDIFFVTQKIRERSSAPIFVMSYLNPMMQYGIERFAKELVEAGGTGIITPDVTPDAAEQWIALSDATGLDRVFLAAPSSSDERIAATVSTCRGFVYAVSTMGITGARKGVDLAARTLVSRLRKAGATGTATLPVCVGIGISTPEQVAEVLEYADGAIVGSALVSALAHGGVRELIRLANTLSRAK